MIVINLLPTCRVLCMKYCDVTNRNITAKNSVIGTRHTVLRRLIVPNVLATRLVFVVSTVARVKRLDNLLIIIGFKLLLSKHRLVKNSVTVAVCKCGLIMLRTVAQM